MSEQHSTPGTQASAPVIELANVSKFYRTYANPKHRLYELLTGSRRYARETRALEDVSLVLERGGRLGIVGENGSGKSTLLKVLAGVLTPTAGTARVAGRVSALLELGAGFNPDLTGRENVSQFCMLHGMRQDEIDEAVEPILRFSELQDAIDHPVRTYSSGMAVRLGFACAVYVRPDILIVDEALSVGDAYFQNKCMHKIRAMLDDGVTFLYVTHAADAVRALCNQAVWMDRGKVRMFGSSTAVGAAYQSDVFSRSVRAGYETQAVVKAEAGDEASVAGSTNAPEIVRAASHHFDRARQQAFAERVAPLRTGSGEMRVDDIVLVDAASQETDSQPFGEEAHVRVHFHAARSVEGAVALNLGVMDPSGRQILHLSSLASGIEIAQCVPGHRYAIDFRFACPLTPGEYNFAAGISLMSKSTLRNTQMVVESVIDYCVGGARFSVAEPEGNAFRDLWGICYVPSSASLSQID